MEKINQNTSNFEPEVDIINKHLANLWWPIVITLIFEIASIFTPNSGTLIIVANVFLVIYVIAKTQIKDHKIAAWLCGSIIFFLTAFINIIKFFVNFEFYYFFTIITEPIVYSIGGAILGSAIIMIINKLKS